MKERTMKSYHEGKQALIRSIREDGESKARAIINDAKNQAEERQRRTEGQIRSIMDEAQDRAVELSDKERKRILTGVSIESRRVLLQSRESLTQHIFLLARKELEGLIQHARYRSILKEWVAEAAVGLEADSAQVNASEGERELIDRKLLNETERRVKELAGRSVQLKCSSKPALSEQGVVVEAADGKTAYNNQVDARIERNQRKIRKLIYERLFGQQ